MGFGIDCGQGRLRPVAPQPMLPHPWHEPIRCQSQDSEQRRFGTWTQNLLLPLPHAGDNRMELLGTTLARAHFAGGDIRLLPGHLSADGIA